MNYPDEGITSEIVAGKFATELAGVLQVPLRNLAEGLSVYTGGAAGDLLLELERDYTWMFFASKPRVAYLFGSVYGEGKLYQESTFAITRLYYEAGLSLKGSAVCSDAFFPFPDGLVAAAEAGATAAIQPGGSVKDKDVIAAADEQEVAMVFTGLRHFRH